MTQGSVVRYVPATARIPRIALAHTAIVVAGLALLPAGAHAADPPPKAGTACTTLAETGRTASGARVDCVRVGANQQWQTRGSRPNPLAWGEAALVRTEYESWRITVDSVDPDVTARVLAVDNKKQPKPGAKLVGLMVTLTYVGKNSESMVRNGVDLRAVTTDSNTPIERWTADTLTDDDCWTNEFVAKDATKKCMMPYEVQGSAMGGLLFEAAKVVGTPTMYFAGTSGH